MTVHIALANGTEAVLFSDSQGSTNTSEFHGAHKQFVGNNFVVGAAGHGGIIMRLFDYLNGELGVDSDHAVVDVVNKLETFLNEEVRPKFWETISILLVTGDSGTAIRQFDPGVYLKPGPPTGFTTIGSGAEFVSRALSRQTELGIALPTNSLADLVIAATHYAEAANESLTVDDLLSVTFISGGQTYLLGEAEVRVRHARPQILADWAKIAKEWKKITAIVRTINSEVREAQREFSNIRTATVTLASLHKFAAANTSVQSLRANLDLAIDDFKKLYDGLIGR